MPLFSIITPVYNNKMYIRSCAESILNQQFYDLEYIIVDDGSTDGTSDVVDQIARMDPRVKVIHQKNQWIYASFNNGIRTASGDYIYIVNSDDRLRDGILLKMADKIWEYERPDIIWTKVLVHRCDKNQKILEYDIGNNDSQITREIFFPEQKSVRANWLYFYQSGLAQNQANLYKRELMIRHPFRNDVYGADTLFNLSVAPDVQTTLLLKEAAYDFFQYGILGMNASIGKYYAYEHQMFNEFYTGYKQLFQSWNMYNHETGMYLCRRRLRNLTGEIRRLQCKNCTLTAEEKLRKIFMEYIDDVLWECAEKLDAKEELECRIFSGIREILIEEQVAKENEMYFVYELLEALLCYEKTEEDYKKIKHGINHPLNSRHVGQVL